MKKWKEFVGLLHSDPLMPVAVALVVLGVWKILDIFLWAAGLRAVP